METFDGAKSSRGCGGMRFDSACMLWIVEGNTQDHTTGSYARKILQDRDIPLDKSGTGDDTHGITVLAANHQAFPCLFETCFDGLITVGDPGKDDLVSLPAWLVEGLTQKGGRFGLIEDLPVEIGTGPEV